jgi:hypothetical protein
MFMHRWSILGCEKFRSWIQDRFYFDFHEADGFALVDLSNVFQSVGDPFAIGLDQIRSWNLQHLSATGLKLGNALVGRKETTVEVPTGLCDRPCRLAWSDRARRTVSPFMCSTVTCEHDAASKRSD